MSEYTDFLQEVFAQFGAVSVRPMFGGYGLYHDGLMFGLIANETLFLKADTENVRYFDELDLGPFEFIMKGKSMKMSYYLAPDEIMDDHEQATLWARRSFAAAERAAAKKKPKKVPNKVLKKKLKSK